MGIPGKNWFEKKYKFWALLATWQQPLACIIINNHFYSASSNCLFDSLSQVAFRLEFKSYHAQVMISLKYS